MFDRSDWALSVGRVGYPVYPVQNQFRILFVPAGGPHVPSSRIRVYDYLPLWRQTGVTADIWAWSASDGLTEQRRNFAKLCDQVMRYDVVFFQRVLFSMRQVVELRRLVKCMIYDFDDAIYYVPSSQWPHWRKRRLDWHEAFKQGYRWVVRGGRYFSERKPLLDNILGAADGIVVGNQYLAEYAQEFNRAVCVVPTPVDVDRFQPRRTCPVARVVIGWLGTPDGTAFVENISDSLHQICKKHGNSVIVQLCTAPKDIRLEGVRWDLLPWSLETEAIFLSGIDIGIMPLTSDGWSQGKCAYKALRYMAAGVPSVVSPVGMNKEVIREGETGFFASTTNEWFEKLSYLIDNFQKRVQVGQAARKEVISRYDRPRVFRKLMRFILSLM